MLAVADGRPIAFKGRMPLVANWFAIGIGLVSMSFGYRLFCGKRSVLLTNLAAGALLALLGMGLAVLGIRGATATSHHRNPDWQRPSSEQKIHKSIRGVERFV